MKKIVFFLLVFFGISAASHAQVVKESEVPKAVLDQFHKDYPNITAMRWELNNWKPKKQYVAQLNFNGISTRARYIEDGTKVWAILTYTANQVTPAMSSATLALFPGFKVDWASEVKNYANNTDVIDLRLSKQGYILHAYVKPDGTIFTDQSKMPDQFKTDVKPN